MKREESTNNKIIQDDPLEKRENVEIQDLTPIPNKKHQLN